jgi:hypothetical protein
VESAEEIKSHVLPVLVSDDLRAAGEGEGDACEPLGLKNVMVCAAELWYCDIVS